MTANIAYVFRFVPRGALTEGSVREEIRGQGSLQRGFRIQKWLTLAIS
jgi:hypothetical protein